MTWTRLRVNSAAAAHLAVYGIVGSVVIGVLGMLIGLGIGLLPVFGIGLIFLIPLAYLIGTIRRVEDLRVAGLFGYAIPARSWPTSTRTDGWRWLQTLWLRLIDPGAWLGVLHLLIITALGSVVLSLIQLIVSAIGSFGAAVSTPGADARIPLMTLKFPGVVAAVLDLVIVVAAVVAILALGSAHASISRMLVPSRTRELQEIAETATRRRDDAVQAATVERSRIERDLHDGVQPRLVSIGMTLGLAKTKVAQDPAAAAVLIDEAHASTKEAITELRQLARGIRPAVLEDRGLDAALSALAARSPIPVVLDVRLESRCSQASESAMYFAVAEALTNAAKHSGASSCRVTILSRPGGMVWARIEDDGHGGARPVPGGGLDGMIRRVQAAGGSLTLTSPDGGPTTIEVSLPCA
ncbi:sensor histidine kinase [Microbacterium gorillae]|uniref:sensor histidine kinase n=1 Tax=Microbacterium gorillae TaxID=1231063 RepID=UPI00058DE38A|nr:histidine kinase [Microbacterium gorillae]